MSNHKNLLFFNKEGDYLNFKYNNTDDRFEGDLIFHENSNDTFKTIGIYTLENIPSFEFESPGELSLNKFQLFNEYGLFFYRSNAKNVKIQLIEPVNNDPSFYSKWIYGENFEKLFPIGTIIVFDSQLLEFTNLSQSYTVIGTKKGAIMIISSMDNATFDSTFFIDYNSDSTYVNRTISAINAIGVYNYIDNLYNDNLSDWSEPSFYDNLYVRKKLNVVNSEFNDGVYTVIDENLTDNKHYEYQVSNTNGNDLIIEVISKGDLPKVYEGSLNFQVKTTQVTTGGEIQTFSFTSNTGSDGVYNNLTSTGISTSVSGSGGTFNIIVSGGFVSNVTVNNLGSGYVVGDLFVIDGVDIGGTSGVDDIFITIDTVANPIVNSENRIFFNSLTPDILKSGTEFKVIGSTLNTNFFTMMYLPTFVGNTNLTYYATQSQVIWNNKIYECIKGYTQSLSNFTNTGLVITPDNTTYWTRNITHLKVDQSVTAESLSLAQIYLTTDRVYFAYGFTVSNQVTLASAAEKYSSELKAFNIDLYYSDNKLKADLMYPSRYAEVNFYHTQVGSTFSIGSVTQTSERITRVEETLQSELNYDISERLSFKIVFTDLDLYGFKIVINKQVYQEELAAIYSGGVLDMPRTIDRTLRNWLTRYYSELVRIGINPEIIYVGSIFSPFVNCIKITSTYPNVPVVLNEILVGTTADYHIEHSTVLFNQDNSTNFYGLGSILSININGEDYDQPTTYLTGSYSQYPDIPETLTSWVELHGGYLRESGIVVSSINNLLKFDVKRLDRRLEYEINTGKSSLPGQKDLTIVRKIFGNIGTIITSNEITLPQSSTHSFEVEGFATGMVVGVHNTIYTYDNKRYNIQLVDPKVMNLSYEGPFWGLDPSICNSSAFITLAFDLGFGLTGCPPIINPTSSVGGPFFLPAFNSSQFVLNYNVNTYVVNTYNLNPYPGTAGLVDLIYVQLSNSIYCFGDNVVVIDSFLAEYISTINLPGNTQSIEIEYNTFNNYLYCLSKNNLYVIDPLLNSLVGTMSLSGDANDLEINPINGDIYVTYTNSPNIDIFDYNNTLATTLGTFSANFPPTATTCGKMVFNEFESDMYIVTDVDEVLRVHGGGLGNGTNRTIQTTYGIPGLTNSIFYEPVNEAVYAYGSSNLYKIDNGVTASISISTQPFNDIIFNNLTNQMNISDSSTQFTALELSSNTVAVNSGVSNYGYITLNQFDGDLYMSSLSVNNIIVVRATTGEVIHTEPMVAGTTKIIYNPDRKSVWSIQPSLSNIIEVEVTVNSSINILTTDIQNIEDDNQYGTLDPDYESHPDIWLKTKEYLRRPRENFEGENSVQYYWSWYSDNVPQMFMYDFSGEQLPVTGSYAYIGPKPLNPAVLNRLPNKDLTKIALPEYQQTIFNEVFYDLSYIDDETDIQTEPEPLQLFLGYKAEVEGGLRSVLQLYKREVIGVEFESSQTNNTYLTFTTLDLFTPQRRGLITINTESNEFFTGKGLKEGQLITIYVRDTTNKKDQYLSENNGLVVKIRNVFSKSMIVDFLSIQLDYLRQESSVISDYPTAGKKTYLRVNFRVLDREIGRFMIYGQTEEEDIRFKIELGNQGKLIAPNEVFIFKEYDINEGGIDWLVLNKKRKEMLMMKHLIYPYIGAYKSIINAINFFGYNDLQLNEYYRDINPKSTKFLKLFKVEIPDIFDNTVEGWTESEFIKNNFPNENYEETNLFNLTYFITDKEGNNILNYSVDEVIIKLQGLKYWLKRNIIPLTHKILDITGVAYFTGLNQITHTSYDVRHINTKENMTPVTFKLNEAYLLPINSGSTVYNCVLDFYSLVPGVGLNFSRQDRQSPYNSVYGQMPEIRPYNGVEVALPDYFTIDIRTYKTYKEWIPFKTYSKGEKVLYYNQLYESAKDNNKINNPREYEGVSLWQSGSTYQVTNTVKYNRDIYVFTQIAFSATASATASYVSTISPLLDTGNWKNITEWREIDYEPVQKISEYRKINPKVTNLGDNGLTSMTQSVTNPLPPFNFTIDSNIDPILVIEVTCDNGYGLIYRDKKNYEIRGIKDLVESNKFIDPIGPFEPIEQVY